MSRNQFAVNYAFFGVKFHVQNFVCVKKMTNIRYVCAENTHCCAASSLTSYAMIMIIRIVMQNENMLIEDDMYLDISLFCSTWKIYIFVLHYLN